MTKARRLSPAVALAAFVSAVPLHTAHAAAPSPLAAWESALTSCAPGSAFDACVRSLKSAKIKVIEETARDWRHVKFLLKGPFSGIRISTNDKAAGRIVAVEVNAVLGAGAPRKQAVTWFRGKVGKGNKEVRATTSQSARDCGDDGWGIGWASSKSTLPEVQLELSGPDLSGPADEPDKYKPEVAFTKKDAGISSICFLLQAKSVSDDALVEAPAFAAGALKDYLESPSFHGKAQLAP